jgi:ribosomal protein L14E/L6E/L27E
MSVEVTVGDLVVSRAGRDKGRSFVVLRAEEGFVYLVDGDLRRLDKPKKKKRMHVKPYPKKGSCRMDFPEGGQLCDADIRKHIVSLTAADET